MKQAAATSIGLGMPNITLALVPGHIGTKSKEQLRSDVLGVTAQQVVAVLFPQVEAFEFDVDDVLHAERFANFGGFVPVVGILVEPGSHLVGIRD